MLTKKKQKQPKDYSCETCDFVTSKKSNYLSHLTTAKHRKLTSVNIVNKTAESDFLCTNCSKIYSSRVGLWSHKKKCFPAKIEEDASPYHNQCDNLFSDTSLIVNLIKENQEFKNLLIEQMKENKEQQKEYSVQMKENNELMNKMVEITQHQITIPTSVTNNNQTFNLNFFLNETCKDAMNIQEFIDNIKITFDDLMTIGNTGFVNGLSDIFIKQLRDLDVKKRPIHCTDSKRDTIYLKEQDAWNKDDKDKTRLKQIIEKIEYKNVAALHNWCNENPDSKVNNTPNNFLRDKIYLQTLQGDETTREKIIKNISKEVVVDK